MRIPYARPSPCERALEILHDGTITASMLHARCIQWGAQTKRKGAGVREVASDWELYTQTGDQETSL